MRKVKVSILDDHPGIIDGYRYRLGLTPEIEIAATASYGCELEPMLERHPTDVLILDINAPTSAENNNPYPVLPAIQRVVQTYPNLAVLVISMHAVRPLIRSVVEAGATGYLLKDDQAAIENLGAIVLTVARGDIHFSQRAHQQLMRHAPNSLEGDRLTPRQLEALSLCAAYPNEPTADLARRMGVANSTMRNLLSGVYLRLNVNNRAAAINQARKEGLITPVFSAEAVDGA